MAAEQSQIRIHSIMTDAQQKYITEEQALAQAKAKLIKSVLTEIPTSARPRQLTRAKQRRKEFGLGVEVVYEAPGSGFSYSVGAVLGSGFSSSVGLTPASGLSFSVGVDPASSLSSSVGVTTESSVSSSFGATSASVFFSSFGATPGSGISFSVSAAHASGFSLPDSLSFSTLNTGL